MAQDMDRDRELNRSRSTSPGSSGAIGTQDWNTERDYWRTNFPTRPYARGDRAFEAYEPAYLYGYESATLYEGRQWNDVEGELRSGWDGYEHRGSNKSTWDEIKDAVRDAWDRVAGRGR